MEAFCILFVFLAILAFDSVILAGTESASFLENGHYHFAEAKIYVG